MLCPWMSRFSHSVPRSSSLKNSGGVMADGLKTLGAALDSGDVTAAQTAWKDLQAKLERNGSDVGTTDLTTKGNDLNSLLLSMYLQQAAMWNTSSVSGTASF